MKKYLKLIFLTIIIITLCSAFFFFKQMNRNDLNIEKENKAGLSSDNVVQNVEPKDVGESIGQAYLWCNSKQKQIPIEETCEKNFNLNFINNQIIVEEQNENPDGIVCTKLFINDSGNKKEVWNQCKSRGGFRFYPTSIPGVYYTANKYGDGPCSKNSEYYIDIRSNINILELKNDTCLDHYEPHLLFVNKANINFSVDDNKCNSDLLPLLKNDNGDLKSDKEIEDILSQHASSVRTLTVNGISKFYLNNIPNFFVPDDTKDCFWQRDRFPENSIQAGYLFLSNILADCDLNKIYFNINTLIGQRSQSFSYDIKSNDIKIETPTCTIDLPKYIDN